MDDVPSPGPAARRALDAAGAPVLAAAVALGDVVARLVRAEGGLTMAQLDVLAALADADGPAEPRELAAALGLGSGHLTAVIDGLERGGLVTRRRHEADGRRRLVEPTEDGLRRLAWITSLVAAAERRAVGAAVGPEDAARLGEDVARVRAAVAGLPLPPRPQGP